MYVYLGADKSAVDKRIIGIFDMDTATVSPVTRGFLAAAQKARRVSEALDPGDLPRSFVVVADGGSYEVYLSQATPNLLKYRTNVPVRTPKRD